MPSQPTAAGILLTHLGTPEAPTVPAIKKYLAEFLLDPYVVHMPRFIWWWLLRGIILPIRSRKSALLYQKIWMPVGSPLLVFSAALMQKLAMATAASGWTFHYALGMRYGKPSIRSALQSLYAKQVSRIVILPLYPQYSTTTTASTFAQIDRQLERLQWAPQLRRIDHYAVEPSYIAALVESIYAYWQQQPPGQKLIFSFHGIPQQLIAQGDPYYDQCIATAQQVAAQLHLPAERWQVVFQSRFGRQRWLQPYCSEVLQWLPKNGYRHIDIICPGFSVDCLETLEEVAITNKKLFHAAGGLTYNYIPALNDSNFHIQALSDILVKNVTP